VQFSPGEYFPKEEGPTSRTTTATGATATPTVQTVSATGPAATTTAAAPTPEHNHSSSLPTGAIVGIAIGGFAVVVLAGALIYMCGRQKTVKELIRQSQPPPAHQAYPASPGMSEAQYSNMQKTPMIGTHYSGQSYGPTPDHESYRTASPPPAGEHQPMMGGMHPMHLNLHNNSNPPSTAGSPGFPSPTYSQEMEHAAVVRFVFISYPIHPLSACASLRVGCGGVKLSLHLIQVLTRNLILDPTTPKNIHQIT